jgi:peptidoglycan hydrolase-like protein with peptidoglycan-binding domain
MQLLIGLISDGKFGPRTQIAVKAFQANAGLKPDGVVGPKSIMALEVAN